MRREKHGIRKTFPKLVVSLCHPADSNLCRTRALLGPAVGGDAADRRGRTRPCLPTPGTTARERGAFAVRVAPGAAEATFVRGRVASQPAHGSRSFAVPLREPRIACTALSRAVLGGEPRRRASVARHSQDVDAQCASPGQHPESSLSTKRSRCRANRWPVLGHNDVLRLNPHRFSPPANGPAGARPSTERGRSTRRPQATA